MPRSSTYRWKDEFCGENTGVCGWVWWPSPCLNSCRWWRTLAAPPANASYRHHVLITVLIHKVYGEALSIDWTKDLCRLLGEKWFCDGIWCLRPTVYQTPKAIFGHCVLWASYNELWCYFSVALGDFFIRFHWENTGRKWLVVSHGVICDDGWLWFFLRWHQLLAIVYTRGVTIRVLVPNFFGPGLTVRCTFYFGTYRKK